MFFLQSNTSASLPTLIYNSHQINFNVHQINYTFFNIRLSPPDTADTSTEDLEEDDTSPLSPPLFQEDDHSEDECYQDTLSVPAEFLQPLYPGSTTTACGAYCSIMHHAIENKLSYTAIDELLQLLRLLMPNPNNLPSSFYKLKKFFNLFGAEYQKSEYCAECHSQLAKGAVCKAPQCKFAYGRGHLVHIPIEKALQTLVSTKFICVILSTHVEK